MKQQNSSLSTQQAMDYFDSLPPIAAEEIFGYFWRGEGIDTDHPMDGMLESSRWLGKAFYSENDVHPLIHKGVFTERFSVNPGRLPLKMAQHMPLRDIITPFVFPLISPFIATRRPKARLRMIAFRGQLSAAMCYNQKPVTDYFRKIDADSVLGWMDFKAMKQPYFFKLYRGHRL